MSKRGYDRLLLATKIGTNRKIRRLKPEQRWAHVAGVLALAAESPVPGHLLIADGVPVEPEDVAEHASVSLSVAKSTMDSLRKLGVLKHDPHAGCEYVHDWEEWNPAPKSDPTAAERMRRYRDRLKNVTPVTDPVTPVTPAVTVTDATAPFVREVEVEVEVEGQTDGPSNVVAERQTFESFDRVGGAVGAVVEGLRGRAA